MGMPLQCCIEHGTIACLPLTTAQRRCKLTWYLVPRRAAIVIEQGTSATISNFEFSNNIGVRFPTLAVSRSKCVSPRPVACCECGRESSNNVGVHSPALAVSRSKCAPAPTL